MSPHRFDRFKRWERHLALPDGTKIFVRPIWPEDETLYRAFLTAVTLEDLRLRFFAPVKELSHSAIARFTQIDYARAMAFIAIEEATGQMLGVVRIHANSEHRSGEYAILVRSDLKGHGLGWLLMELMIEYARAEDWSRFTVRCCRRIRQCCGCAVSSVFTSHPTRRTPGSSSSHCH
jgi:acetyltransferase